MTDQFSFDINVPTKSFSGEKLIIRMYDDGKVYASICVYPDGFVSRSFSISERDLRRQPESDKVRFARDVAAIVQKLAWNGEWSTRSPFDLTT